VRFEVDSGGRRRLVDAQRSGRDWIVTVDGRVMRVNLARVGARWSMLVRAIQDESPAGPAAEVEWAHGGRSHEVALDTRRDGSRGVWIDGRVVPLTLLDRRSRVARSRRSPLAGTAGPVLVPSPMPGRVARLLVSPGEVVAARQGLVVVEAMKMENELRAPRAGTVAEVRVRQGDAVEAHTVLVVLH
jgi:biotin carboxyl carrier protein